MTVMKNGGGEEREGEGSRGSRGRGLKRKVERWKGGKVERWGGEEVKRYSRGGMEEGQFCRGNSGLKGIW